MKKTILFVFCCIAFSVVAFTQTPQNVCPAAKDFPGIYGFPQGKPIYFNVENIPGLNANEKAAIRSAIQEWSSWTASNGFHNYNFVECASAPLGIPTCGDELHRITILIGKPSGVTTENAAYTTPNFTATSIGVVPYEPAIFLNLNNTSIYNSSNFTEYIQAIKKAVHHEMGHIHGLKDQPIDMAQSCGGQVAGASIMNGFCGMNDSANNMTTTIKDCDKEGIQAMGPPPGGGPPLSTGCSQNSGSFDIINGGCWITYCFRDLFCDGLLVYTTQWLCGMQCIG
jgi:hypothetical protein